MIRTINAGQITELTASLFLTANTYLPPDIGIALECAAETEHNTASRTALEVIVENFKFAAASGLPICQDCGMAVVFAAIGQDVHITGGLFEDAVNAGVRKAYYDGKLRCSVVRDPLRRVNTDDNTPAVIYTKLVEGTNIKLTAAPKGFGSENMSASRMFNPTDTREVIEDWMAGVVNTAGSKPCPPIIIGAALGGTLDACAVAAKKALLRPIDTPNVDVFYAEMERNVLRKVNAIGIGAQGFGGRYTALGVNIDALPTHIAGLPAVVNISCHVTRHAVGVI
ncbi:MAG: fumarate hydratase [Oscillospiraceae bacterium]|jgi:fumarate hydratase subunit alpha|nr:fumarate hydratase [Oscillospiraceae bacterium]